MEQAETTNRAQENFDIMDSSFVEIKYNRCGMVMEKVLKINYISTKIKIRRNGMELEWNWKVNGMEH